jgi:DNA-binding IscR family transcriptional regulator
MPKEKKVPGSRSTRGVTGSESERSSPGIPRTGDSVPGYSGAAAESSLIRKPVRKSEQLLAAIRTLALKEQRDEAQVFLSLREAAKRFGATTSEVREVYRQLGKERILRTIRGSHTMLLGRRAGRILKVNGVIGIPVSLRRFMTMRDYRVCFLKTREELHACGFATQSFFFEQSEASPDLLIAKLEKAGVDAALWLLPDGADRETGPRLRDRGIQFIGVNLAES